MSNFELGDIADRARAINAANGWTVDTSSPIALVAALALITTEVAEAIEDVRDGRSASRRTIEGVPVTFIGGSWVEERHAGMQGAPRRWASTIVPKPEGLPSELADVIIRALDLCSLLGIKIDDEIDAKLDYNATRGHRHGEKTL